MLVLEVAFRMSPVPYQQTGKEEHCLDLLRFVVAITSLLLRSLPSSPYRTTGFP